MRARRPAILLALGVGKDIAINFSLASAILLVIAAIVAALGGVLASVAMKTMRRTTFAA